MSRRDTRRGRSLDDCGSTEASIHLGSDSDGRSTEQRSPGYIVKERGGCKENMSMGDVEGWRDALEDDYNMALAGNGVCVLAVDGEVVVSPENFVLIGSSSRWRSRGADSSSGRCGDDATHWAPGLWCECHGGIAVWQGSETRDGKGEGESRQD